MEKIRTVNVGKMKMMVRKVVYCDDSNGVAIDCGKVEMVIRDDGTVHLLRTKKVIAYTDQTEVIEISN